MKTLLTILLLIPIISFSQTIDCNSLDKIISVQGSVPFSISVEAGAQSDFIGLFIGAKGKVINLKGTETLPASQGFSLNPYAKLSLKVFGDGEDNPVRIYAIGYAGTGKIWGAGLKIGVIVEDDLMLYVSPEWTEQKFEGNIGLSFRF
jgi:hypothetical protein